MSWDMARESGGRKFPSRVQGQSPGRGLGRSPPEAEAKCEISVQLYRFPIENLGFNEYRSRAWTVYFGNTIQKKI